MKISDEAVEAALNAYDPSWSLVSRNMDRHVKRKMREALEAAAPLMKCPHE